jgi:hypothetical protein
LISHFYIVQNISYLWGEKKKNLHNALETMLNSSRETHTPGLGGDALNQSLMNVMFV